MVAALLLVATVGFAALVALFVLRSITRSSGRLAEAAGRMAKGDLTARIEGVGDDEMGRVGAAFNAMSEEVGRMISRVATTSGRIATAAGQVYSSSEAMATGAEQVASQATTVATAGEEMSATSSDIAANWDRNWRDKTSGGYWNNKRKTFTPSCKENGGSRRWIARHLARYFIHDGRDADFR